MITTRGPTLAALLLCAVTGADARAPVAAVAAGEAPSMVGFSPASVRWQREYEERLRRGLSPQRIEEHLRWLTSRPHPAGSDGARATAEYLRDRLAEYGLEPEIVRYDAWLTAPVAVHAELVEPVAEILPTTEDPIEADPFTAAAEDHPGWNGYSASGEVTAQVVYACHGSAEDFRRLRQMGVEVRGRIVLLRYFGVGEGRKVRNAERAGAAAVVLYADPAEDGYPYGLVYPEGNWRPWGSIMRRSVEFTPFWGDPLTPGWASVAGTDRLDPQEAGLPGIPVVPVSYRSAHRILSLMAGPPAPLEWQGALPLTYRIGPGPAKLHLQVEMDNRVGPVLNVVGRLTGQVYPDQWVILGNHHDAWIYGAGDPSSGTAALLELARGLGRLAGEGFRPRRTVIVAFWDAEEFLLGGSTEWAEDHAEELLAGAVAVVNMDSAVFNPDRPLRVAAHPTLHSLFRDVARDIVHPRTGRSLYETWAAQQEESFRLPSVDGYGEFLHRRTDPGEPWIFEVPSDDAAPFFHYLALPASDMYYGGHYGMYHSIYENFHWMKAIVDPDFRIHRLMAELQGRVGLRLANADLPPLDFAAEARLWRWAYEDLAAVADARGQTVPRLEEALELIDRWQREAEALAAAVASHLGAGESAAEGAAGGPAVGAPAELSRGLSLTPRDFYRPGGSPGRPWNRNLFAGYAYEPEGVSGSTLPGLRFALDEGDGRAAEAEAAVYIDALRRRVATLRSLRGRLGPGPAAGDGADAPRR